MKKSTKIAIIVIAVLAVLGILVGSFMKNNTKETPIPTVTVTPTMTETLPTEVPTLEPTVTEVPTITEEPTEVPTITETPIITTEPTITEVPEVTETPVVTVEPTVTVTEIPSPTVEPTATPVPTATSTPTPTPSPLPTLTPTPTPSPLPTPTPAVDEGLTPDYVFQMGDNVWYKYYNNSELLVISGTGATWDLEAFNSVWKLLNTNDRYDSPKKIVIEEGITHIGTYSLVAMRSAEEVIFPSTLKSVGDYAFYQVGSYSDNTTWVNLDLNKIKTEPQSFYQANGLENIEGSAEAMCTPTPTPTATPTPVPNPEQPRKIGEYKHETNNTKIEYYDNGYVYVSANGKAHVESSRNFDRYYTGESREPYGSSFFTYIVVNEGVTEYNRIGVNDYEFWLPTTMDFTSIKNPANELIFTSFDSGSVIHGYYNGKKLTVRFVEDEVIKAQAEKEGLKYQESGHWYMPDVCEVLATLEQTGTVTYSPNTIESALIPNGTAYWAKSVLIIEWE